MATPATQPTTPNALPGVFLPDMFGPGFSHSEGINDIILNVANAWTKLGNDAAAGAFLPYVLLHNGVNQSLLVPISAIMGPDLTINGNFDHFTGVLGTGVQTSPTTYNKVTSYAADQFFVLPAGASVTQQRSTTVPTAKSQYSLLINGAASVTTVDIGQRYEARAILDRGFQSQAFCAQVFNGSGAAFTPNLRIGTPAAVDDFTTVTNRRDQPLQSCADNQWTFVYDVFDPSAYTNLANGMEAVLRVPTGVLVATKTARVAQWSLRPGTRVMGFVPDDPDNDLRRARRFWRTYGGTLAAELFGYGFAATTTAGVFGVPHGTPMRIVPAVTISTPGDFNIYRQGAATIAATSVAQETAQATVDQSSVAVGVAAGLTLGEGLRLLAANTNARLHLNARL